MKVVIARFPTYMGVMGTLTFIQSAVIVIMLLISYLLYQVFLNQQQAGRRALVDSAELERKLRSQRAGPKRMTNVYSSSLNMSCRNLASSILRYGFVMYFAPSPLMVS